MTIPRSCHVAPIVLAAAMLTLAYLKVRGRNDHDDDGAPLQPPPSPPAPTPPRRPRVLVTGFGDWRNLDPAHRETHWKSNENPSSRLLLGAPCLAPPLTRAGPLVRVLKRRQLERRRLGALLDVDWSFQILPTLWQTASGLDYHFWDVVVS